MTNLPYKKLKLSFAMGGGVSLGAFSGAALTEALKLLLVEGMDNKGRPYTHIELDSMSGASAGAISLCIMLASLLNYKRYLSDESPLPDNKFRLSDIDGDLANQFGVDWQSKYERHIEPLRALQLSQRLQEKLWVKKVNMRELMRIESFDPDNKDGFSLLNRNLLIELVNSFILADVEKVNTGNAHIINENRFLFACSLTNLIPMPLGNIENKEDPPPPLVRELRKAHASFNHKELRVFDFQLNDKTAKTSKLLKSVPITAHSGKHRIDDPKTWSMIASTCLACGAFPFAFEPVALNRYVFEYLEPSAFQNSAAKTKKADPDEEEILDIQFTPEFAMSDEIDGEDIFQSDYKTNYNEKVKQFVKHYTGKSQSNKIPTAQTVSELPVSDADPEDEISGDEVLLFSYIDGGTLNNEPIREAFRMANYIDSRDPSSRDTYDRIVLFVDPIVRTEPVSHNSNDYDKFVVTEKHQRLTVKKNTEMNRLTAYVGKLIRTLRDQGSIKEEHKITTYVSSLKLNQKLADLIAHSTFDEDFTPDFVETFYEFLNYQDRSNYDEHISTFNVNDDEFIGLAIQRYVKDYSLDVDLPELIKAFHSLRSEGVKIRNKETNFQQACDKLNEKIAQPFKIVLKKMLYNLLVQMIMNTDGKDPDAMRMAITPVQYPVEFSSGEPVEVKTIELPGEEFQAFGGFVNEAARAFSNEYGRYCAYKTLTMGDFRKYYHHVMQSDKADVESLILENEELENGYRKKLISLSPVNKKTRANLYWRDVRLNIINLMKRRLKKSAHPFFKSGLFLGGVASLSLVLLVPWYLERALGLNGVIAQVIMLVVALIVGYLMFNNELVQSMKKSFYNHQIHSLKLGLTFPSGMKVPTHYRFNNKGKFSRLLKDKKQYLLPIPFYLKRDPSLSELDIEGIEIKLVPNQQISKHFNRVFSQLEFDANKELESVQLYRRKWIWPFKRQLDINVDLNTLKNEPKLKAVEQRISPLIACVFDEDGHATYELVECAIPLEETIQQYHQSKSLT